MGDALPLPALIPLKGHSARVPNKNLRSFRGRPLFHAIIETLQQCVQVGDVYIDTDSDDIAESARGLKGVTVLRRKPHLEGDDVSVNLLIGDFLTARPEVRVLLQTHATNPLVRPQTIDRAIDRFRDNPMATSLFSVTRIQARCYDHRLRPINHNLKELLPTQNLAPIFVENSNLYIFERAAFFDKGTRISDRPMMFEMDPIEAVDIDEERDFDVAAAFADHKYSDGQSPGPPAVG